MKTFKEFVRESIPTNNTGAFDVQSAVGSNDYVSGNASDQTKQSAQLNDLLIAHRERHIKKTRKQSS